MVFCGFYRKRRLRQQQLQAAGVVMYTTNTRNVQSYAPTYPPGPVFVPPPYTEATKIEPPSYNQATGMFFLSTVLHDDADGPLL